MMVMQKEHLFQEEGKRLMKKMIKVSAKSLEMSNRQKIGGGAGVSGSETVRRLTGTLCIRYTEGRQGNVTKPVGK